MTETPGPLAGMTQDELFECLGCISIGGETIHTTCGTVSRRQVIDEARRRLKDVPSCENFDAVSAERDALREENERLKQRLDELFMLSQDSQP